MLFSLTIANSLKHTQVIGAMGAMDSVITVDPDPQADLKHVRAPALPGTAGPALSYCLPACLLRLPVCLRCLPTLPALLAFSAGCLQQLAACVAVAAAEAALRPPARPPPACPCHPLRASGLLCPADCRG